MGTETSTLDSLTIYSTMSAGFASKRFLLIEFLAHSFPAEECDITTGKKNIPVSPSKPRQPECKITQLH